MEKKCRPAMADDIQIIYTIGISRNYPGKATA